MKLDVLADLDHLLMINFSAPAKKLEPLAPHPMRLLERDGRGFPSIVLPRIENLRPSRIGFPRVDYELFGLRLLVEYESLRLGAMKGIYFQRLIMDPNSIRMAANVLTPFAFERGHIHKKHHADGSIEASAVFASGETAIRATARPAHQFPSALPPGSCFSGADEALAPYNDIAFGFLPGSRGNMHILQIAEPHPNYVAWPFCHLELSARSLGLGPFLAALELVLEPCYFVGRLPRYWRWLASEARVSPPLQPAAV